MPIRSGLSLAIAALLVPSGVLAQTSTSSADTPAGQAQQLDAITVRGEYIPEPMLDTPEVASFVTREDFERTGDSDAAVALGRVSGLSVVGRKFVYVRGLGERYSSALFNGSPLPSPEPMQRVVPLDLFPSKVLESITVQKTYSARYPGEFGGGVIDLQSLAVPDEDFLTLSVGISGNSVTTGENGLTYYGSDDDEWGFDDGARKMSPELSAALATGRPINSSNFSREEIRTIGRSFNDPNLYLLQQKNSIDPGFDFGASAGYSWELDDGVRLGTILVADFKNEWSSRDGVQQEADFLAEGVDYKSDYQFFSTRNNARWNGMFGLGLESENHTIGWTTLYVHDSQKEARSRDGFDFSAGGQVRDDTTSWIERELINNQIRGTHSFGEYGDLKIEWRGAVATATRESPYETNIRYQLNDGYWAHLAGGNSTNDFNFSKVDDETASGGIDVTWRLPTERDLTISGGLAYSDNDRNFSERRFRYRANGALPFYNQYQRIDYLFSDYNLSNDLLELIEITGSSVGAAAYDATLKTSGAYVQFEGEIASFLRGSFGLRYEDSVQAVHTFDIFSGERDNSIAPLRNDYLLPALTLTWNFAENQQIRFGASKTLARPQFREMAPQQYTDPDNSSRLFAGNPNLVDSELINFDARYEWFFSPGEYFTAGVFYKDIDKPVEANINTRSGGAIFQSYLNAPAATLYGVELDAKKYLELPNMGDWLARHRFYIGGNYTWSDSEIQADAGDTVQPNGYPAPVDATLFVQDGDQMQGQADHIANLQFGLESDDGSSQATLVANYVSERISARGLPGQPDYLQKPGTTLDLVLSRSFPLWSSTGKIGFTARNLLDTEFQEFQEVGGDRVDVYRYEPGIAYDLSLTVEF
ncbi:TonB-dependent receptor domain-containing protein [Luteimonas cellulosilyticus]